MWEHLFDWTHDDEVWSWIRTAFAALAGAVTGGLFSLWGQSRASAAQAHRDQAARIHQREEAERLQGTHDGRAVLAQFIDLNATIRASPHPPSVARFPDPEPVEPSQRWIGEWRKIWTFERRTNLRQLVELLPDRVTREALVEIMMFLDLVRRISNEGSALRGGRSIYSLVSPLSDEAVRIVAAFLRGEAYETKRRSFMEYVRQSFETGEFGDFETAAAKGTIPTYRT